jgi:ssDNA thymidine ADP-ribosyltransferase, DarT
MLYNIKTGYRNIKPYPQSEIIYIVCKMQAFLTDNFTVVFTDGHAKSHFTRYFTMTEDLEKLDWATIKALHWQNTLTDNDKMRKKQAECLIKSHVPPEYIVALVVYDAATQSKMMDLIQQMKLTIRVHVNPNGLFYY